MDMTTTLDDAKGEIVEPGNSWGHGEGWAKVMELIEIARKTEYKVSPELRERILQRALASVEADRRRKTERRRVMWRALTAGACAVVLIGVVLRLIGAGAAPAGRSTPELAAKATRARVAAE